MSTRTEIGPRELISETARCYARKENVEKVVMSGFVVKRIVFELGGGVCVDTWITSSEGFSSGQILLRIGDKEYNLVYGGSVMSEKELEVLGISKDDVLNKHREMLLSVAGETRFNENCGPIQDGDWRYEYLIEKRNPSMKYDTSRESLFFKDQQVFEHTFILPLIPK